MRVQRNVHTATACKSMIQLLKGVCYSLVMYSVAGVERYPLKVHKSMGAKLIERRSKVKPFIKVSDYLLTHDN